MLLLNKPDESFVGRFVVQQKDKPFSYPEVGASRHVAPSGYNVDHNRILLGEGYETYLKAIEAVKGWKMFDFAWLKLCWSDTPIVEGATVGILVRHLGFWSLNACRVVYVMEENGEIERYGFAYGTLPEHAERGEERFTVEYHPAKGQVWYDLYAFSKPRHMLARAGYPVSRLLQKRFAGESKKAMVKAVNPERI
ncbi:MAG TPA: DUF1990 domain-containing protein [Pyrinomonadaceae bacterium]|jgi:uncharacterized protein (UPF0548 family)